MSGPRLSIDLPPMWARYGGTVASLSGGTVAVVILPGGQRVDREARAELLLSWLRLGRVSRADFPEDLQVTPEVFARLTRIMTEATERLEARDVLGAGARRHGEVGED